MREGWGGIVEPSGVALVWRYPPTSEWITGRTIYSKPLSGGALQIYERRRPFNRLAQSSLTAVVKPPFPRLSSTPLSVTLTELHPASISPSAWLGSPAVLACQPFILYRSESVRFGPNIKGDVLASARDRDAKSLRFHPFPKWAPDNCEYASCLLPIVTIMHVDELKLKAAVVTSLII